MSMLMIDDLYPSMPWDKIDHVVFDVGNVLLTYDPAAILREQVPDRPDLHPALMNRVFRSAYWPMMDQGAVTNKEATELMCRGQKELEPYIRRIMDNWIEMKDVIQEGVDALRLCHAKGKKIYILSNYGDAFDVVDRKYDFFRLADGMVISSRVRMIKPDPAIYKCLTERYELDPSRTLFIDDSGPNVAAAMSLGWHGLCFNEKGKVSRFIK